MKCLVCDCSAGGAHYQSVCCRACAAFFKRTYLNDHQDCYICRKEKKCDVTDKNRYSCRYCRLKKCFAVGMTWYGNDDPSTSADNPDEPQVEMSELESDELIPDEFYTYETLFKNYDDFFAKFQNKLTGILSREPKPDTSNGVGICHQIKEYYLEISKKWLNGGVKHSQSVSDLQMSKIVCNHYQSFELTANFCSEFRQFCELPLKIIFLHFVMRFPQMFRVFTTVECLGRELSDRRMVSKNGYIYDFTKTDMNIGEITNCSGEELRRIMLKTQETADQIFAQPYKRLKADDFENAYLIVSGMWSLEGVAGLTPETLKIAEEIRDRVSDELTFYYKHEKKIENCAQRIYQLHNLVSAVDRLAEIRTRDREMYKMFNMFKIDLRFCEVVKIND